VLTRLTLGLGRGGPLRAYPLRVANELRGLFARHGDPPIRYTIGGKTLSLPVSHDLPYLLAQHPDYGGQLPRLARLLVEETPDAAFVDIGANVGDTAALLREACFAPVLCIEGSPAFFPFLEENLRAIGPDLVAEKTLIGSGSDRLPGQLSHQHGTAGLSPDPSGGSLPAETLDAVLARHPRFSSPRLVKIDTDGLDCPIVLAHLPLWKRIRPVLSLEYDPFFADPRAPQSAIFERLRELGYDRVAVHENIGDYLLTLRLDDRAALEDLDAWLTGRGGLRYADLTFFHRDDAELAERFRRGELAHFAARRGAAGVRR